MSELIDDVRYTTTLVAVTCGACGIPFGMSREYYDRRQQDKGNWHCPNGHSRHFLGETEEARLRAQLESARRDAEHQRQQRTIEERKNRALRGELTKTKKRVAVGVCPCCNRTFENLARHMKGQHPDFATPEVQA